MENPLASCIRVRTWGGSGGGHDWVTEGRARRVNLITALRSSAHLGKVREQYPGSVVEECEVTESVGC